MSNPTITLVATTFSRIGEHLKRLRQSAACFPFPVRQLLISGSKPEALPNGVDWAHDPVFDSLNYWGFNRFVYEKLADFITTDFAVTIHTDGFAQHPEHWTDEFLKYDYVGAPFPVGLTGGVGRVGSGGFCLRSRKLLQTCQRIPLVGDVTEDWHIGHNHFRDFKRAGCRFASVPLALRWSIDLALEDYPGWSAKQSFGFHDNHGSLATIGSNEPFKTFV